MARLHHLVLAGVLAVASPACTSNRPYGREMNHEDAPRCYEPARDLERRGIEAVEHGAARGDTEGRRDYYTRAIDYFRDARALFEEELLKDPEAPPERRANCEREIERLDELIRKTAKDRPL